MQLLPAGVPRSLRRLPRRIASVFEDTPVLFLAVVLGIALVFRVGIGVLRPAPTEAPAAMTAPSFTAPRPVASAAVDADPRPKGHIVDPPPTAASGRQRAESPPPIRKKRPFARPVEPRRE